MGVKRWGLGLLVTTMLLTGCGENPAESVYQHLEAAVELEMPFEQQQEPLQKAELRENELFEQIISLGLNEFDQIVELADEAIASINARESMLAQEKESIEESYLEFTQIEEKRETIEDEEMVNLLNELAETMNKRYDSYQNLYGSYEEAIQLDQQLFQMLQKEDVTMESLQEQINLVNDIYEKVNNHKENFNSYTDEYNSLKREFYEKAELNVQYD
ncbi:YkyA family protein [Alkalihalobacillus sp. MEB130]|uniref:YkyA family protein n=1 Tax=Alkalihalobacillus sp. MEB130 TaxID=2976704 RepID=UPI0028DFAE76|nr:YkyA family protein [Alkalihalobacillus sp. MEB130]MDT8859193.1 YkyA family protein [Alkalihalobacillus sp. MEB130]